MTSKMVTHENKNMKNLSISYINKKIKSQFSSDIELAISDTILCKEYKNHHSYKKREKALNTILRKYLQYIIIKEKRKKRKNVLAMMQCKL